MSARWVSFGLWALIAASAVGWGFRLFVKAPPVPPEARVADAALALRGDPARVLGADPVEPAKDGETPTPVADNRFQLIGVVAPRSKNAALAAREGVALIAVDGKPPRAYRVGAAVDQDTVLKVVRARGAELGPRDGAATIALELAPPPPAATGTLPAATATGAGTPAGASAAPARPGAPGVRTVPPVMPVTPLTPPAPPPAVPLPPPARLPNLPPQAAPDGGSQSEGQGVVAPSAVTRS